MNKLPSILNSYPCSLCASRLPTARALLHHAEKVHLVNRTPFPCLTCNLIGFRTHRALLQHQRNCEGYHLHRLNSMNRELSEESLTRSGRSRRSTAKSLKHSNHDSGSSRRISESLTSSDGRDSPAESVRSRRDSGKSPQGLSGRTRMRSSVATNPISSKPLLAVKVKDEKPSPLELTPPSSVRKSTRMRTMSSSEKDREVLLVGSGKSSDRRTLRRRTEQPVSSRKKPWGDTVDDGDSSPLESPPSPDAIKQYCKTRRQNVTNLPELLVEGTESTSTDKTLEMKETSTASSSPLETPVKELVVLRKSSRLRQTGSAETPPEFPANVSQFQSRRRGVMSQAIVNSADSSPLASPDSEATKNTDNYPTSSKHEQVSNENINDASLVEKTQEGVLKRRNVDGDLEPVSFNTSFSVKDGACSNSSSPLETPKKYVVTRRVSTRFSAHSGHSGPRRQYIANRMAKLSNKRINSYAKERVRASVVLEQKSTDSSPLESPMVDKYSRNMSNPVLELSPATSVQETNPASSFNNENDHSNSPQSSPLGSPENDTPPAQLYAFAIKEECGDATAAAAGFPPTAGHPASSVSSLGQDVGRLSSPLASPQYSPPCESTKNHHGPPISVADNLCKSEEKFADITHLYVTTPTKVVDEVEGGEMTTYGLNSVQPDQEPATASASPDVSTGKGPISANSALAQKQKRPLLSPEEYRSTRGKRMPTNNEAPPPSTRGVAPESPKTPETPKTTTGAIALLDWASFITTNPRRPPQRNLSLRGAATAAGAVTRGAVTPLQRDSLSVVNKSPEKVDSAASAVKRRRTILHTSIQPDENASPPSNKALATRGQPGGSVWEGGVSPASLPSHHIPKGDRQHPPMTDLHGCDSPQLSQSTAISKDVSTFVELFGVDDSDTTEDEGAKLGIAISTVSSSRTIRTPTLSDGNRPNDTQIVTKTNDDGPMSVSTTVTTVVCVEEDDQSTPSDNHETARPQLRCNRKSSSNSSRPKPTHSCTACYKGGFTTFAELKLHRATCQKRPATRRRPSKPALVWRCPGCPKPQAAVFASAETLLAHLPHCNVPGGKRQHPEAASKRPWPSPLLTGFGCSICGLTVASESRLDKHCKEVHQKKRSGAVLAFL